MANKFADLRAKMSPQAKAESARLFEEDLSKMPFNAAYNSGSVIQTGLDRTPHLQTPAVAAR
jgi:hypothetical protein